MAITIELAEYIDHPAAAVFSLLTDVSRQPEWIDEVEAITHPPDLPLKVGSSFEHTAKYNSRLVTITIEVVAFEPNHLIRYSSSGTMPTVTTWRLEPEGEGTRLHFTFEGQPNELYDMIAAGLEGSIKRGFKAQISNLQQLLDASK